MGYEWSSSSIQTAIGIQGGGNYIGLKACFGKSFMEKVFQWRGRGLDAWRSRTTQEENNFAENQQGTQSSGTVTLRRMKTPVINSFLNTMGSTIRCAGVWTGDMLLPSTDQSGNRLENRGSLGPRKGFWEDCLVACRVVHAPQGKAQLTIGILPGHDVCFLSQGLSCLNPAVLLKFVLWDVLNEWWGDHAVSFQWSLPNLGRCGCGDDSAPRQRGDQMSFREPNQPENPGLPCATGCILKACFSAPWVIARMVNSTLSSSADHQSPPPSPTLEIIHSFLVSFPPHPLCLRNNEMSWVCHPSLYQQQVVTSY